MLTDPVNEIAEQQGGKLVIVTPSDFRLDTWGVEESSCPGNPELGMDELTTRTKTPHPTGRRYAY